MWLQQRGRDGWQSRERDTKGGQCVFLRPLLCVCHGASWQTHAVKPGIMGTQVSRSRLINARLYGAGSCYHQIIAGVCQCVTTLFQSKRRVIKAAGDWQLLTSCWGSEEESQHEFVSINRLIFLLCLSFNGLFLVVVSRWGWFSAPLGFLTVVLSHSSSLLGHFEALCVFKFTLSLFAVVLCPFEI